MRPIWLLFWGHFDLGPIWLEIFNTHPIIGPKIEKLK
jgi:hypothetical protein